MSTRILDGEFTARVRNQYVNIERGRTALTRAKGRLTAQLVAQRLQSAFASLFASAEFGQTPRFQAFDGSTQEELNKALTDVPLDTEYESFSVRQEYWQVHSGQLSGSARTTVVWRKELASADVSVRFIPFLSTHIWDLNEGVPTYGQDLLLAYKDNILQDLTRIAIEGKNDDFNYVKIFKHEVSPRFAGRVKTLKKKGKVALRNAERTLEEIDSATFIDTDLALRWGL